MSSSKSMMIEKSKTLDKSPISTTKVVVSELATIVSFKQAVETSSMLHQSTFEEGNLSTLEMFTELLTSTLKELIHHLGLDEIDLDVEALKLLTSREGKKSMRKKIVGC